MPDIQTPEQGTEEQDTVIPEVDPGQEPEVPETPVTPEAPEEPGTPTLPPQDTPPAPETPAPELPPVEERYRQSSSEAMIQNSRANNLEKTLNNITSEDTPTEAELLTAYPTFKQYDATTQAVMRDTLTNRKMNQRILRQQAEADAERKWQAELRTLTTKPQYAALKGDQGFEAFVFQSKHKNVDIAVLADAYMVRNGLAQPPAPAPKAPATGGLPRGSGGPRTPVKTAKVSIEQASVLRNTNYKEYLRLLKAGMIEEL
jgi:hypothetical protein